MARTRKVVHTTRVSNGRNYGVGNFVLDVVLTCITSGLWLIWVFVREMRNR